MNIKNRIVWARYSARLTDICLGVIIAAAMIKGATFNTLVSVPVLFALFLTAVVWLSHVLDTFANTGDIPADPPIAVIAPPVAPPPAVLLLPSDVPAPPQPPAPPVGAV